MCAHLRVFVRLLHLIRRLALPTYLYPTVGDWKRIRRRRRWRRRKRKRERKETSEKEREKKYSLSFAHMNVSVDCAIITFVRSLSIVTTIYIIFITHRSRKWIQINFDRMWQHEEWEKHVFHGQQWWFETTSVSILFFRIFFRASSLSKRFHFFFRYFFSFFDNTKYKQQQKLDCVRTRFLLARWLAIVSF